MRRAAPGWVTFLCLWTISSYADEAESFDTPGFPAQTERFPLHPIPTTYKTRMCENWKREGKCPFGQKCTFAHGADELNQAQLRQAQALDNPTSSGQALHAPPSPAFPPQPFYMQPPAPVMSAPVGPPAEGTIPTYYPDLEGRRPEHWVCVMGLGWWVSDADLDEAFAPVARAIDFSFVFDIPSAKSKGIVFIEFESELAVTKALEAFGEDRGKLLNLGKKVTVIAAESEKALEYHAKSHPGALRNKPPRKPPASDDEGFLSEEYLELFEDAPALHMH